MTAPWAPMAAPPLPCRNDEEFDTCEHAYPRETCRGNGRHMERRGIVSVLLVPHPLERLYGLIFAAAVKPDSVLRLTGPVS